MDRRSRSSVRRRKNGRGNSSNASFTSASDESAMNYAFDFQAVVRNFPPLLDGLAVTVQLTAVANLIGLTFGFAVALIVMSRSTMLRAPATLFVEFFRCTPALVQIIWIF